MSSFGWLNKWWRSLRGAPDPSSSWPVELRIDDVSRRGLVRPGPAGPASELVLREMRLSDQSRWFEIRDRDKDWLSPWEATMPPGWTLRPQSFPAMVRYQREQGAAGEAFAFVLEIDGLLAGQITVFPILRGPSQSATIGYWIAKEFAGRGVMTTAVARVCDFCFFERALHRIEINIRPENGRSLRIVEKLGFRDEGYKERYLHIGGQWADHISFALTAEEVWPSGVTGALEARLNGLPEI